MQKRYRHLNNFLGTEFEHELESDVTSADAVTRHVRVYDVSDSRAVADEAVRFLREQHNDIESAFADFHLTIQPAEGGAAIAEWIAEIARLFDEALSGGKP